MSSGIVRFSYTISPFAAGSEDWHNHDDYKAGRCVCHMDDLNARLYVVAVDGVEEPGTIAHADALDGAEEYDRLMMVQLQVGEAYTVGGGAQPVFEFRRVA
jgi:hypothetical protein